MWNIIQASISSFLLNDQQLWTIFQALMSSFLFNKILKMFLQLSLHHFDFWVFELWICLNEMYTYIILAPFQIFFLKTQHNIIYFDTWYSARLSLSINRSSFNFHYFCIWKSFILQYLFSCDLESFETCSIYLSLPRLIDC